MAAAAEFNSATARANIQAVRPGMRVFELSSKSGAGMRDYFDFLDANLMQMRSRVVSANGLKTHAQALWCPVLYRKHLNRLAGSARTFELHSQQLGKYKTQELGYSVRTLLHREVFIALSGAHGTPSS